MNLSKFRIIFFLFLSAGILIQCRQSRLSGDIKIVKSRIIALNTGNGISSDGKYKKDAVKELETEVQGILDRKSHMIELNIESPGVENRVSGLFGKIQTLAKGYNTPGQKFYHSGDLLKEIEMGLKHGEQWIKPGMPRPGNWYYWKIDAPRNMGPALILMQDYLNKDLMKSMIVCMNDIMTKGPYNRQGVNLTGANGAMMGMNFIYYAVLTNDEKELGNGLDLIEIEMSVTNKKSGILEDYSYQFHDQLLYTGGYGAEFTYNAALALYLMNGTKFEITKEETELFYKFILEHVQWVLIGDKYDIAVKGRGVRTSPTVRPTAFLLMSTFPSDYQDKIKIVTQRLLSSHSGSFDINDAPFADLFPHPVNTPLNGFRYFPKTDYGVSRKPGFFVSVKMFSDQNMDYEILTGSNPGGHHRSSGFTYISRNGNEIWQNTRNLDGDYDWEHLPGTTSRLNSRPPNFGNFSKSKFAGGAGSDENGIISFQLIPVIDDFQAKKSYFMFDKGFVALGSDINSSKTGPDVSTTLAQWGTKNISTPLLLSNGENITSTPPKEITILDWAYCDSVGYVFNNCKNINIRKDSLYATIFLNHGPNPQKATYAYTVLPACSRDEVINYIKSPEVKILENSENIHALKDLKTDATGIVFWKAGTFDKISVNHPAIVYYEGKDKNIALSLCNPFYNQDTIQITIKGKFDQFDLPSEASVTTQGEKTVITIKSANRRLYRIGLGDIKVKQVPREDNLPYEEFKILKTVNTKTSTFLTVRIPEIARTDYRLYIHYWQSFFQKELLPSDRTDTLAPDVYIYRWDNPNVELKKHYNGDYNYNLRLRSGVHNVWEHFTVER
jgi:hyaluronate lyase